jgi:hypothetical protein
MLRGHISLRGILIAVSTIFVIMFASEVIADIISGSSTTAASSKSTLTQLSINKPPVQTGDVMIASIAVNGGTAATVTAPTGWTQIARTDNDINVALISYWKVAGASEPPSYTWSVNAATTIVGGITPYSGVDTSNPIDIAIGNIGFGTSASTSPGMTSAANEEVIAVFATNVNKTFSTPHGMAQKYNFTHGAMGPEIANFDTLQPSSGAISKKSANIAGAKSRYWASQLIAVRRQVVATSSIGFDKASIYHYPPSGTLINTFPHTVSGNNRVLFLTVANFDTPYDDIVSSVTYNNVPMTRVAYVNPGSYTSWMYVLFNPDIGTHDVVVTLTQSKSVNAIAASYTGATSTGSAIAGLDDVQIVTNFGDTITGTTTPTHDGDWAITSHYNGQAYSFAGTNVNAVRGYIDGAFSPSYGDSNGPLPSGVPYAMTWNSSLSPGGATGFNDMIAVSLAPSN